MTSYKDKDNSLRKSGAQCKKEQIKILNVVKKMDRVKKMQCWVILKRFMVGRDGWAFNKPLDLKGLDKNKNEVKKIGFVDIEYKLKKCLYSDSDEFARDMRLVFFYASLHPRRSEIYKVGRRVSESFEISWKSLNDKWLNE